MNEGENNGRKYINYRKDKKCKLREDWKKEKVKVKRKYREKE